MKPIVKLILPTLIALVVIVPSLLIKISTVVQITLESQHLSFLINQYPSDVENEKNSERLREASIPFAAFTPDKLELTYFDHVFFKEFDLYIYAQPDSLTRIRQYANIEITPLGGRWKEFSRVYLEAENENSLFIQSLQTINNSQFQFEYQSEGWLFFQVDELLDSIFVNHKPNLNVTSRGQLRVNTSRCNLLTNGDTVAEVSNGNSAEFIVQPASDFSIIKSVGEPGRMTFRAHFPSERLQSFSKVEMYDPRINEWGADLAPLPTPREHAVTAVVGDKIYVIGGDRTQARVEILSDIKVRELEFKILEERNSNVKNVDIKYERRIREDIGVKKAFLDLDSQPYKVSNIDLGRENVICTFSGPTRGSRIDTGIQETALSPTLFEWLYKNQFLATVLGAVVWLMGTAYSLIKEWGKMQKLKR